MQAITVIEPQEITTRPPELDDLIINTVLKNVAASSRRVYLFDIRHFLNWCSAAGYNIASVDYAGVSSYKAFLEEDSYTVGKTDQQKKLSKGVKQRRLIVARRLIDTAILLGLRQDNPAKYVKGYQLADETTHTALTKEEVRALLAAIDRTTAKGKRDYALIMLLLRTGLRRAEAAALTLADFKLEQGHHTLTIRHGKGDKRRTAKIPVDVMRAISDYLEATNRKEAEQTAPLFVRFKKGDKPKPEALDGQDIERIVKGYAKELGLQLTPHGLRASFVTITLEGGAKLQQVQYAAGHSDPRTTERYQKRKLNLDDNAVDYFRL